MAYSRIFPKIDALPASSLVPHLVISRPSTSWLTKRETEPEGALEPMDTGEGPAPGGSQEDMEGVETPTCYCGDPRELGRVELMCGSCFGWFHANCISANIGKCVPFMTCYQFYCKNCSVTKQDSFQKRQATFSQMCHAALANLIFKAEQEGETSPTFSKEMTKETDLFMCTQEDGSDAYFTLAFPDLSKIAPVYDRAPAAAQGFLDTKSRSAKRKGFMDSQPVGNKQKKSDLGTGTKLPPHGYPLEHPFNKDGYRYYLAEADPHAPNRQAFDESVEWAGKPIPGYLYRVFLGNQVYLSMHDRAPQLKLSDDRFTVTGEKGYSMIRASHGVISGQWYFEVTVDEMPEPTATRIGWSQALGNLQAPCGYDKFSYSWRSRKGTRFHQSRGYHYCDGGYGEGDVLGFYISLPLPEDREKWLPQTFKDRFTARVAEQGGLEENYHQDFNPMNRQDSLLDLITEWMNYCITWV
ncbi:hypothetical protein BaRGS_00002021 [Batillaria attramentaria]|uniref:B30.2/SPRY domain-containing protein n=1 Tax=Batillaria attramentaria TaxID=370345 RepID=A0ABD0M432_9CAEN